MIKDKPRMVPQTSTRTLWVRVCRFIAPLLLGILADPFLHYVAFQTGGYGHGDYRWAKLLFPYAFLVSLSSNGIGIFAFLFSLLQFPLYGVLLSLAFGIPKRHMFGVILFCLVLLALVGIHGVAVWCCLSHVTQF